MEKGSISKKPANLRNCSRKANMLKGRRRNFIGLTPICAGGSVEAPWSSGSGHWNPTDEFGLEQIKKCKEQGSARKFVDCFMCVEPVMQMLERTSGVH